MKIKNILAAVVFIFISASPVFAASKLEHYIFKYSDYSFDVKLTDNSITWKALDGSSKGQIETDYISRKRLSNHTEVIQWTENDGTFVTVIFDRHHHKVISSGRDSSGSWLWSGKVEEV